MIVDDEIIVRQAVKYMIENNENYEIIGEAQNGLEACELISVEEPHVLICDIAMPIMDGVELIKFVKLKYPDILIIVLSGYDDFDYVKECFQQGIFEYLLKPKLNNDNLTDTLEKICMKLGIEVKSRRENIIKMVLYHKENTQEFLNRKQYEKKNIGCMAFNLKKIVGFDLERITSYCDAIYHKILDIYENHMLELHVTKDNILMVCVIFDQKKQEEFLEDISSLSEELKHIVLGLKIAYSPITSNYSKLIRCVENTYKTAESQFFIPNTTYEFETNMNPTYNKLDLYKRYREREEFIEDAYDMIQQFLSNITYLSGYKEEELKKQMEHIMYSIFNHSSLHDIHKEEEFDYMKMIDMISDIYSLDDLKSYIDEMFLRINKQMKPSNNGEENLIDQILTYIKTNYQEQLTLQEVSSEFHISYSYLSTYFSNRLGLGFSEYLNKIRVEQAKLLLKSTDYSIHMICEQVGYLDQSYFSKVFKKFVGSSPTNYRRK